MERVEVGGRWVGGVEGIEMLVGAEKDIGLLRVSRRSWWWMEVHQLVKDVECISW